MPLLTGFQECNSNMNAIYQKTLRLRWQGKIKDFYVNFRFSYNHEFWRRVSSHEVTAFATGFQGQNSWLPMSWYYFCIKNISLWISSQVYPKTMEKIYYYPGNRLVYYILWHVNKFCCNSLFGSEIFRCFCGSNLSKNSFVGEIICL